MIRILLPALLFAVSSAFAQTDDSEIFLQGGRLLGPDNTTTWTYESGFISKRATHFGIGFAYNNEGHLADNHRDGLTAQAWYLQPFGDRFEVQLGTGPYLTMNNTTVDGVRENEFKFGLLTSFALKWHPTEHSWYLRAQYNNAWVRNSFHSNAVLLGVGRDFSYKDDDPDNKKLNVDVSFWGGSSRTTQIGPQDTALGYEFETKFRLGKSENLAYSVSFLSEGDTGLVKRRGVPVELWYDQPAGPFTFSFGVGPYFAYDSLSDPPKFRVAGIGTLRVTYALARRYAVGLMYHRVASFYNKDEDIAMLGLLIHL